MMTMDEPIAETARVTSRLATSYYSRSRVTGRQRTEACDTGIKSDGLICEFMTKTRHCQLCYRSSEDTRLTGLKKHEEVNYQLAFRTKQDTRHHHELAAWRSG